jgi:GR25 family glycosyltransferase involved in LPS biosynthesis
LNSTLGRHETGRADRSGFEELTRVIAMRTYLINLDRSSDRLSDFWRANENLNIEVERFSAVDGTTLNIAELEANGMIDPIMARTYTPGAVGAALSHVALWERAIAAKERVTIIEDDAIFNFQYESSARDFLAALDEDWDFVLWGWNFDAPLLFELIPDVSPCSASFDQAKMITSIKSFQRCKIKPSAFRLLRSFGTSCYSVSPRGARALKAGCLPIRTMTIFFPDLNRHIPNTGVDCMMNAVYSKVRAYVAFPPLVVTKNEIAKSLIQRKT